VSISSYLPLPAQNRTFWDRSIQQEIRNQSRPESAICRT
jgi:hypothetical protein